jgi:hypothetical protein
VQDNINSTWYHSSTDYTSLPIHQANECRIHQKKRKIQLPVTSATIVTPTKKGQNNINSTITMQPNDDYDF